MREPAAGADGPGWRHRRGGTPAGLRGAKGREGPGRRRAARAAWPARFTGEPADAGSGLVSLRARYLDPATGRFLTRDAFGGLTALPTSRHPSLYAHADPADLADPSGHSRLGGGIGGAAGGGAGGAPCRADDLAALLLSDPRDSVSTEQRQHRSDACGTRCPWGGSGLNTATGLANAALFA